MNNDFGVAFFRVAAAPGPPPPSPLPMDTYATGMLHAFALKQILAAYGGPLVRVRRSSDNTELDIGYVSGGAIDSTALAAFVGSNDGFATKWYDQIASGAVDAVQPTSTKQPKIVSAGTYLATLKFDGVDDYLITHTPAVNCLSFAGFMHVPTVPGSGSASYFVHPLIATSGNNGMGVQYQSNNAATNTYMFTSATNYAHQVAVYSATYTSIVVIANRSHQPALYYADGASRNTTADTVGTITSANFTDQDLYIGSDGSAQPCALETSEFVIWSVDQTTNNLGIFSAL